MAAASSSSRPADFREPGSAPRWRVGVGAVLVVVLVLVGVGVVLSAVASARESVSPGAGVSSGAGSRAAAIKPAPSASAALFVHVLGRVERPGLYEVGSDARAIDVVAAAGGFAAEADQGAINLARPVTDGEQIVVPKVGEAPAAAAEPGGLAGGGAAAAGGAGGPAAAGAAGGQVDLNSADQAALETLSGVGPATASAILAWREEHGRFQAVEDLLDVTGIGEKKLAAMRDSVTVR